MIDLDENKTPEAIIAEAMVSAGAPLMHSRVEEAVAGALRKAGMLAEQSGQVCAWCPSPARGSAHHNDGKLHPSCGQTNHGQGWVPDYPVERIGAIEAERDAALARIAELEAKVEGFEKQFPCDGGCNYYAGPDEECSRHGRRPEELWQYIADDIVGRDAATERAEKAEARIAEAAKLHQSEGWPLHGGGESKEYCTRCNCRWPCATIAALGLNEGVGS